MPREPGGTGARLTGMHTKIDVDVPTQLAGASVFDATGSRLDGEPSTAASPDGAPSRLTVTEADMLAPVAPVAPIAPVAPVAPVTPVDVFFTPPAGLPVVEWPTTAVPGLADAPPVPAGGLSAVGRSRRERRQSRRRTRLMVVAVGAAWAVALVGVVAYVVARDDGDPSATPAPAAAAPAGTVPDAATAPDPAPSDGDPATDAGDAVDGGAVDGGAVDGGAAAGATGDAQQAVRSYIATRGTDAERAFSSQGGRDELDAVIADLGRAVPQGEATCTAVGVASFTCVQDTDQGAITFTVGPDPDDPDTSGFEVVGAATD